MKIEILKPCPFCGGEAEITTVGNDFGKKRKAIIKCKTCFVQKTVGAIRNNLEWCIEKAKEFWNKRAT